VFFRQERVGQDGEHFGLFKFRSMDPDAEAKKAALRHLNEASGLFKIENDPRITRVGRFLRKTSLDELPQLLNVVAGDISLVGPRALTADELATYYGASAQHLLAIRPGVTGYWQINGRSILSYDDRVRLDLAYIGGWSLGLDLMILARTARVLVGRRGAV
jgi:lipopolysaccharide/colanic/teichoic acid biosynthesis glycosyltransferase